MSKYRAFSQEFKQEVIERMRGCPNITELGRELGIARQILYRWKDQATGSSKARVRTKDSRAELRAEVARLKGALADKVLEVSFFKGALQKIEERRRQSSSAGDRASTSKSEK